jgi:cytochrome c biogenesis protein CcmG/thiol:disulfide interchange protein DsbE
MRGYSRFLMASGALVAASFLATPAVHAIDGRAAPDVALPDAKGVTVRLSAYKGRVVLVDFWASWCPPCKASFPALDRLSHEYEPQGVAVLAINVDEKSRDADSFLSAYPHTMTVLFDPKGESPQAFGVRGMPSSFVIDRTGNIRFTHMGYTANVVEQYRQEIVRLLAEH